MPEAVPHNHKEDNLLASIKVNDTATLKKLYSEVYPKVELHILRNSGSAAQAKDIFQEAMVALWRAARADRISAENPSAVQGYLYTIAKNKWTGFLRSSTFKKEISSEKVMTFQESPDIEIEDDDYEFKLKQTKQAFELVGDSCKDLLIKFYFEKLSLNEIANVLGLDAASARNKKYRCMQKLRGLVTSNKPQN